MFENLSPHPTTLPNGEGIVENKICKHCNISFEITDKDLEFYEKVSPIFDGKKYLIPSPTLCPDCRQQRRLSFRNERKIYKRNCDFSGKEIISMYSPDKPHKIYYYDFWESDKWNPLDYGKDFDFSKGFFDQFSEILLKIPQTSIIAINTQNSEYSNCVGNLKNCYLLFGCSESENCLYGYNLDRSKNCVDCSFIYDCQECYNLGNSYNCFKTYNSFNCRDCSNSNFITNCLGCNYCFACAGINNKKYCILNKQYSKEDYENILNNNDGLIKILNDYEALKSSIIVKYFNGYKVENSTGDYLYNSKNIKNGYIIENSENCKYITFCRKTNNSMDFDFFGDPGEWSYENLTCGYNSNNCLFSISCMNGASLLKYCHSCYSCQNCFGCIGLKNQKYCILNKQYSKEEYEKLVPKIIEHMMSFPSPFGRGVRGEGGEWGEFFPSSISPFGYNETIANEYFPLNPPVLSDIPLNKGDNGNGVEVGGFFNWSFYEAPFPKVEKIITVEMYSNTSLLDDISKIPDDILNWAIECEITKKPFRIIKQELDFYRKHNLPIPRRHPEQRHLERMKLRNPRKLFDRICDKCGKNIKTTYSPDRKEIVYCESCYEKEVY